MGAITAVEQPALSNRALALVLDDSVRTNEVLRLLVRQVHSETRQRVWAWMKAHFEPLTERVPLTWRGYLPLAMAGACSEGMAQELQTFFADKIQRLEGGPRNLRAAVEAIELCHAVRTRYQDEAQRLLRDSARAAR